MMLFEHIQTKVKPAHLFLALGVSAGVLLSLLWSAMLINAQPQIQGAATESRKTGNEGARLTIYREPVSVRLPGSNGFRRGHEGMIIPEGSTVRTGSEGRAALDFGGGTVARVDGETQIAVAAYAPNPQNIVVRLVKGRIWSRIKELHDGELYQSESKMMTAVVRGASYGHDILDDGQNQAVVLEGFVDLNCKNLDRSVRLGMDEKAVVNCSAGTGLEARAMNAADQADEWILFNKSEDKALEDELKRGGDVLGVLTTRTPAAPASTATITLSPTPSATKAPPSERAGRTNPIQPSPTELPTPTVQYTITQPSPINTAAPSPQPSPTVHPIEIIRAEEEIAQSRSGTVSRVFLYGTSITNSTNFVLRDKNGRLYIGSVTSESRRAIPTSISKDFPAFELCGDYTVEISSYSREFEPFTKSGILTIQNCKETAEN